MEQHQTQVDHRGQPSLQTLDGPMSGRTPAQGRHRAHARWSNNHFINLRLSIPLVFTRVYVTLVAGKERRSAARRRTDRQEHPLHTRGNMLLFGSWGALSGLSLFALVVVATVLAITHFFEIEITLR